MAWLVGSIARLGMSGVPRRCTGRVARECRVCKVCRADAPGVSLGYVRYVGCAAQMHRVCRSGMSGVPGAPYGHVGPPLTSASLRRGDAPAPSIRGDTVLLRADLPPLDPLCADCGVEPSPPWRTCLTMGGAPSGWDEMSTPALLVG
eukprot:8038598-Pyramimonas_sp.AAC.1